MPYNIIFFACRNRYAQSIVPNSTSVLKKPARFYSAMSRPNFAPGSDVAALETVLRPLLTAGRWQLTPNGEGIERTFKFKTFAKTWDFMTAVSLQCKMKNHHPEWSNVYNTAFIRWTTHNPKGLSAKDVDLAAICDSLADAFGEIESGQDKTTEAGQMRDLTLAATTNSGNCCGSKSTE